MILPLLLTGHVLLILLIICIEVTDNCFCNSKPHIRSCADLQVRSRIKQIKIRVLFISAAINNIYFALISVCYLYKLLLCLLNVYASLKHCLDVLFVLEICLTASAWQNKKTNFIVLFSFENQKMAMNYATRNVWSSSFYCSRGKDEWTMYLYVIFLKNQATLIAKTGQLEI